MLEIENRLRMLRENHEAGSCSVLIKLLHTNKEKGGVGGCRVSTEEKKP